MLQWQIQDLLMEEGGGVDDTNRPPNYALIILSCPTFVPEHGNLGRKKAGWLHKFFGTHVFPFVFPSIIF